MQGLIDAAKRVLELRGDNGHSLRAELDAHAELAAQVEAAEKPARKKPAPKTAPKTASGSHVKAVTVKKKSSSAKKR